MHNVSAGYIQGPSCGLVGCLVQGVIDAAKSIGETGVKTDKSLSAAAQDLIIYLLSFVSLIAVIYVMYAGARLLLNPADTESATKTKKIIFGVFSGILIIWFAWWIVSSIFFVIDNGSKNALLPKIAVGISIT